MFCESRNDRRRRIGNRTAADRLRDRDNAAGIGDNSAEIGDAAGICDAMLNSNLNGDWSNSVPGRQIPEGMVLRGLTIGHLP